MNKNIGMILKCIGGFYYVRSISGEVFECKARGVFRKTNVKPVAGDKVEFSMRDDGSNVIIELLPRRNFLIRPPIANLDQMFILSSILEPKLNLLIVDKLTVICSILNIDPVIVISKTDLADASEYEEIYKLAGIKTFCVSSINRNSILQIKNLLKGKVSAFIGNSGVGKTTMMNCLFPELMLNTAKISKKLGRGKHTTRQVEFFSFEGGYVADTPGFSSIDMIKCAKIDKEKLAYGFNEFRKFIGSCQFNSCLHICEKGCKIIEAVDRNEIHPLRYQSYLRIYDELKHINSWDK